jgi:hypothetical protein
MSEKQKQIRRSLISETTRNIDSIAYHINEGQYADKALMVKLINRMIAFLNEFIKPKEEVKEGHGLGEGKDEIDKAPGAEDT